MTLSNYLSRIKVDMSNHHKIIPIMFDLQDILQEKYYIQTSSRVWKEGITVAKIHRHDKYLLPHLKPEKAAKITSQPRSNTASPNPPHIPANVPIRKRVRREGTNPLLKPQVFSQ